MNKKALAALVGTLAFGTVTVTAYAGEAPAKEEKPKAEKGKKDDKGKKDGDKKGGKDGSCSGAGGCSGKKEEKKDK